MPEISKKKRKFIKRNFKRLSTDELARQTGLKPNVIRSLIEEYTAEKTTRDHPPQTVSDPGVSPQKSFYLAILVALFTLTVLVYTPALKNEFVWDDRGYITENPMIRSLNTRSLYTMLTVRSVGNWHPLTSLSHGIDYAFWGLDPMGYHFTNIIFHGLNTLLVFFLVIQLMMRARETSTRSTPSQVPLPFSTRSLIVAGITSLLFALHPLQVESVAWVAERKNLLCSFFSLLTFLCYLTYTSSALTRHRWMWFTTCLFLFLLALMSKPMAVTIPVVLLLLDGYPLKRMSLCPRKNISVLLEKIPFFVLSIIDSIITIVMQRHAGALMDLERFNLGTRLLNALSTLVFYLEKMIIPVKLVPFYPFPSNIYWLDLRYLLSGILLLAITGFCLWMAKQKKYLFFTAWSYYVVTLLPVAGIIQVGNQAAADRYTYLPSLSIFLLVGIGVLWVCERISLINGKSMLGGVVAVFICVIMLLLGQLTVKQIRIWHNSDSLWYYISRTYPKSVAFSHYNLGITFFQKGRLDEAISAYRRALVIKPRYAKVHFSLGYAYVNKGMLDEAISEFKRAIAINSRNADAHYGLGFVYDKKGMSDEALFEYKQAININPRYAEVHYNLGVLYQKRLKLDEAIFEYKQALASKPRYPEAHQNLSFTYYYKGKHKLAIIHCDKARQLGYRVNPQLLELLKPYR